MKKLTLTFCAMFVVLTVAPAIYADGPEGKKEVMQPAPPVCELYRAHEWDLDIWGAFMFAGDSGRLDVPNDDPFSTSINGGPFAQPDVDPGTYINFFSKNPLIRSTVNQPAATNPNERINVGRTSANELFARDNTFGGGVDLKYFWSRFFGAGIEGMGIAAKTNFAGAELATLTVRYPWGRFAPYGWGGIGALEGGGTLYHFFNERNVFLGADVSLDPKAEREFFTDDLVQDHHTRGIGQLGVGLEYRVTCHVGLMADFSWNFVFGTEDHADKLQTVIEQGTFTNTDTTGRIPVTTTVPIISKATNLLPGNGSNNQDFGMARFGFTFSY